MPENLDYRLATKEEDRAKLVAIWEAALNAPLADPKAGFFENNGDPEAATIVVIKVKEVFGVAISLQSLFEAPTLDKLLLTIDKLRDQQ